MSRGGKRKGFGENGFEDAVRLDLHDSFDSFHTAILQ